MENKNLNEIVKDSVEVKDKKNTIKHDLKYYSRDFLNKGPGLAAIEINYVQEIGSNWVDSDIIISDCHKQISLELYSGTEEQYFNTLHKISTLIDSLMDFKVFLLSNKEKLNYKK